MARPIGFDRADALNAAYLLFWRVGYQAASLSDLIDAMRISRSSFYAAFGDKRTLFVECLDLFHRRTMDELAIATSRHPPLGALRKFFERTMPNARGKSGRWGCMLVNTLLEMADVDEGISEHASGHLSAIQKAFENCLTDAGFDGSRARDLAGYLMLVNQGLRVASRRLPPAEMSAQLDTALSFIANDASHDHQPGTRT